MRSIVITIALLIIPCATLAGSNIQLLSVTIGDEDVAYLYSVSRERLSQLPEWDGVSAPPLSEKKALRTARRYLDSKHPEQKRVLLEIELRSTLLRDNSKESGYSRRWYYKMNFRNVDVGVHTLPVIIFMDNTILEPTTVSRE